MFLDVTIRRNPELIRAAINLHQSRIIPPNTYLIDIDTVLENSRIIVESARRFGIKLYGMTKQQGRNPFLARAMVVAGIRKAVAVDFDEAKILHAFGIEIGHLGHLTQIPDGCLPEALRMSPEVITVFSLDKAQRIGELASKAGKDQPLLLRVVNKDDYFYRAQEGGFLLENLTEAAQEISRIDGIRIEGVTTFPCLIFDYDKGAVKPAANLSTLIKSAEILQDVLGNSLRQINGPGITTSGTMGMLYNSGVTHGEPGSSLSGHTPLHAYSEEPERPAMVYISEVSHRLSDRIFFLGGGLYPRGRMKAAIVARSADIALSRPPLLFQPRPPEAIDYYGELQGTPSDGYQIGDTVICAFRSQVFVSRSYVAVASGINSNPRLLGLFDHLGNPLDPVTKLPLGRDEAREVVESGSEIFTKQN